MPPPALTWPNGEDAVPIAKLLGLRRTEVSPGRAVFEMDADVAVHGNPMGTLHGGILCDIADAAMGTAWATQVQEGETFTTLELKINFLRPFWSGPLKAVAHVVKPGRTVGMLECDVFDDRERLIARASSTCLTLRGELAEGR